MNASQMDLFGSSQKIEQPTKPEKKVSEHPSCWNDCALCLPEFSSMHGGGKNQKIYRVCRPAGHEPRKCFETSLCCSLRVPHDKVSYTPPSARGWEDY